MSTNIHYAVKHVGWGNVTGAIFTDRAAADKAFKDLAGGDQAAMMVDHAFKEISYYGRREGREKEMSDWASTEGVKNIHFVTKHEAGGHVEGQIYTSRGSANKALKDLAGGDKAAMLIDNAFQEISYYGRREGRETEMVERARSFK